MLKVKNLSISFRMYDRMFNQIDKKAVHDISLTVEKGEIHAVVGSSGSGKSLFADAILGILPNNATTKGEMYFKDEALDEKTIKKYRGKNIFFVPQSITYLDPLMKINRQIFGKNHMKESNKEILEKFNLKPDDGEKFPFQLSGGMARRALIMTSLSDNGELIVADEPTPGLNPKLATEILSVFRDLANAGKGVLLITHDIDLVCDVADRVSIFYGGTILETLSVSDFSNAEEKAYHPYTKALWRALPQNEFKPIEMSVIAKECKEKRIFFPVNDNIFELEDIC